MSSKSAKLASASLNHKINSAVKQLPQLDIYAIELEQCCVIEENVTDEQGNKIEY